MKNLHILWPYFSNKNSIHQIFLLLNSLIVWKHQENILVIFSMKSKMNLIAWMSTGIWIHFDVHWKLQTKNGLLWNAYGEIQLFLWIFREFRRKYYTYIKCYVATWNCNSIKIKHIEPSNFLSDHKIHIMILNETKLKYNNKLWVKGFQIIRKNIPDNSGFSGFAIVIRKDNMYFIG